MAAEMRSLEEFALATLLRALLPTPSDLVFDEHLTYFSIDIYTDRSSSHAFHYYFKNSITSSMLFPL